jgi:ribA/ribD-fused uncharacterized protein
MAWYEHVQTYRRGDCAVFRKTREQFGGLSNMASGYPLVVNGITVRTSEALYQACRFPDRPDVQRAIIEERSPMAAKMWGRKFLRDARADWQTVNIEIMGWCQRVKLAQHFDTFGALLLSTNGRPIVEESARDDFWGAKPVGAETLVGRNALGRLLTELRDAYRRDPNAFRGVESPPIGQFLLYGEPIGAVSAADDLHLPQQLSLDMG